MEDYRKLPNVNAQKERINQQYKIGLFLPMHHKNYRNIAVAIRDNIMMRANELQDKNILITLYDYQDEQSARLAAQRAKAQHVDIIIGPLLAKTTRVVEEIFKDMPTPIISFSNQQYARGKNTIIYGHNVASQIDKIVDFLQNKDIKKIYVLAVSESLNQQIYDILKNALDEKNISIELLSFKIDDENSLTNAELIKETLYHNRQNMIDTALVMLGDDKNIFANVLENVDLFQMQKDSLTVIGLRFHEILEDERFYNTGMYYVSNIRADKLEDYKKYVKKFHTQYGYIPAEIASLSYNVLDIINKIKLENRHMDINSFLEHNFNTIEGETRINKKGFVEREIFIHQINQSE